MIIDTLDITEPSEQIRKSKPGDVKTVEYKVKNKGDFDLVEFDFDVYTVKKVGEDNKTKEPIYRKTSKNYAEVVSSPKVIQPGKTEIVKVKVDIPTVYKETVKRDDGKTVRTPFRVQFGVYALEDIKEL